jgi:hypothetical protein
MVLLLSALLLQDEPVDVLIRKLGSDSIEEREEATERLRARVDDAQEELEKAGRSDDAEIAGRAREILGTLTPHRLEVCAELTHLRGHALQDAIRRVVPSWTEENGMIRPSRYPARSAWPTLLKSLRESVLANVDFPSDGRQCPIAVRCRLETIRMDLDLVDARLEDVLGLIGDLTGLNLAIDANVPRLLDMDRKFTFRAVNQCLAKILGKLLSDEELDYGITDKGVVLIQLSERNPDRY